MKHPKINSFAFFGILLGAPVMAQTAAVNEQVLENITVTGASQSTPTRALLTPFASQKNVISETDLREQNSQDFSQAFKMVPGVMTQSKNLIGSQTSHSLYVRGRGASHPSPDITILYDDVPRGGALYGQTFGDSIAINTIGGMTVVKGAQPVEFGSGYALVNIEAKRMMEAGQQATLGLAGGAHASFDQQLSAGYKNTVLDIYAAQSWVSTDGHRDHSRAQQQNYYANLGYALQQNWDLRLLVNRTAAQTQAPQPDRSGPGISAPMARRFDTTTNFATLSLNNHYSQADGYIKLYRDDTDFDMLGEKNGSQWSRQSVELYGARAREMLRLWAGGEVIVGADLDYADLTNTATTYATGASSVYNFPDMRLFSPYFGVNHTFGSGAGWHLTPSAGFRYYDHNEFGNKNAPQAGLVLGYGATDVSFNYARGVNYPSPVALQNLVQSGNSSWRGKLKAEVFDHYELGVAHSFNDSADASLTVFRDKGKDRFRVYMYGPLPTQWNDTAGEYTIRGLELAGSLSPWAGIKLMGAMTWLDADATGANGVKRNHLPYTPEFALQLGANMSFAHRYQVHVDLQHLRGLYQGTTGRTGGFDYAPVSDADKLGNITVVNTRFAYTLQKRDWSIDSAEVFLAIDNLFDRDYEYAKGYPMPGISAMLGVNVRFR